MFLSIISLIACAPSLSLDTGNIFETADTGMIEDSGDTADTDMELGDCEFLMETVEGESLFGNNLYGVQTDHPSNRTIPQNKAVEIMRFTLSATDPNCEDLRITEIMVKLAMTDNDSTNWMNGQEVTIRDLSGGNVVMGPMYIDSDYIHFIDDFGIKAGETGTYGIYLDTRGAGQDEFVQATVPEDGLILYDIMGTPRQLNYQPMQGNPLMITE
jgi:hypothetical protein